MSGMPSISDRRRCRSSETCSNFFRRAVTSRMLSSARSSPSGSATTSHDPDSPPLRRKAVSPCHCELLAKTCCTAEARPRAASADWSDWMDIPCASSGVQPKTRVAPLFHSMIVPSLPATMIASSSKSTSDSVGGCGAAMCVEGRVGSGFIRGVRRGGPVRMGGIVQHAEADGKHRAGSVGCMIALNIPPAGLTKVRDAVRHCQSCSGICRHRAEPRLRGFDAWRRLRCGHCGHRVRML